MIVFYGMLRQKVDGFRMKGVSARTFSTSMYGKMWEHVVKTAFKN